MPVAPPGAAPGSHLRRREPLKASKWETHPKRRRPLPARGERPLGDDQLARRAVDRRQRLQPTRAQGRGLRTVLRGREPSGVSWVCTNEAGEGVGEPSDGGPPGLIPNPVVQPDSAAGTVPAAGWESTPLPTPPFPPFLSCLLFTSFRCNSTIILLEQIVVSRGF